MKALSIRHPAIATLLAGHRSLEVRRLPSRHRGEMLLHASATFGPKERLELERLRALGLSLSEPAPEQRGALLGVCDLTDCRRMTAADWERALLEPSPVERWAWQLESVEAFPEPVRWRGHLFVFEVQDADLQAALAAPSR